VKASRKTKLELSRSHAPNLTKPSEAKVEFREGH
jgi:hypothetical protein